MEKKPVHDDKIGTVALLTATMLASGIGITVIGARPARCAGMPRSVRLQMQTPGGPANSTTAATCPASGETAAPSKEADNGR